MTEAKADVKGVPINKEVGPVLMHTEQIVLNPGPDGCKALIVADARTLATHLDWALDRHKLTHQEVSTRRFVRVFFEEIVNKLPKITNICVIKAGGTTCDCKKEVNMTVTRRPDHGQEFVSAALQFNHTGEKSVNKPDLADSEDEHD